ncbi:MAG: HisA/HisF-related TIM barrel protein [Pirellulales bacterium]
MAAGRLIGVLDVMAGRVVHATGGRRSDYRPVNFPWLGTAEPRQVADRLASRYGLKSFYVADLDALTGGVRQWEVYAELVEAGYQLWVDSGLVDMDSWREFPAAIQSHAALRWVLGTETLRDAESLVALGQAIGWARCVVSVDLRGGNMLLGRNTATQAAAVNPAGDTNLQNSVESEDPVVPLDPVDLVGAVVRAGAQRVLVLELACVGAAAGPGSSGLCSKLRAEFPQVELWYGGGVRDDADVNRLAADGVDRVLVATALFRQTLGSASS